MRTRSISHAVLYIGSALVASSAVQGCSSAPADRSDAATNNDSMPLDASTRSRDGSVLSPEGGVRQLDASRVHSDADTSTNADASNVALTPLPFDCPSTHFGLSKVKVGEVSLQVACQGSGPLIVMLHGYPELYLTWTKLAATLAAKGYAVVAPDQRGYNVSDKPDATDAYNIDHLVADIRGLIEASGRKRVLLVAHDWGGVVGWVFTHRHPEYVRGLVEMDGPHPDIWGHPEIDPVQSQASSNYIPLLASPAGTLAIPYIEPMLSPHLSADELTQYRAAWNQPNAGPSMIKWYQANVYPTYTLPTGNTIGVPTLVLWGEDDAFATPSELDYLPNYVADLKIVTYAGVDHWITHQITDELTNEIVAHEQRCPP